MASSMLSFIITSFVYFSLQSPWRVEATPFKPSSVTDREALLAFKSHLDSNDVLSSWNDSTNMCDWDGVTCGKKHPDRVTSLKLDSVKLSGTISPSLGNLSFLIGLQLPYNKLHGHIPKEIGLLRRLRLLNFTSNSLEGEIPESLSLCKNLEVMSLSSNKLHGEIPGSLSLCRSLEAISLSQNKLHGEIPGNLSRLSNLIVLTLKNNMLTGNIPLEFGSFEKLKLLSLRNNNLTGSIPPSIGNISSLRLLFLSKNNLVGSIPSELSKNSKLEVLDLMFNNLSGGIPPSLFNFSNLYTFGVGDNQLEGSLPSTFGQNLPFLRNLYLFKNHFEGNIPSSLVNASRLQLIQLHNNNFSGPLPDNLGMLQDLGILFLRCNKLVAKNPKEWGFIKSLTNCSKLIELDLSKNNFSDVLPGSIANLSTSLELLRVQENQIIGQIPKDIGKLKSLLVLDFQGNQLSGPIPFSIGELLKLKVLIVASNKLSGELPSSLCNLSHMLELYLGDNYFIGNIPSCLYSLNKMIALDISHNNLSGTVPKGVLGISSISLFLDISHNSFTGPLPFEVGNLKNLRSLDVSENKFSGEIPGYLGQCQQLIYLSLEGNEFNRRIPYGLKDLKGIEILDLSQNNLSGPIPDFFKNWGLVQFLNLSFNDLEGEVPTEGVFSNISLFSVEGNEKLCGGIHELNLKPCSNKNKLIIVTVISVVVIVLISLLTIFIAYKVFTRRKERPKFKCVDSWRDNTFLQVSHADLVRATNNFSSQNLIGSGGYGCVFKGILDDDKEVAVKVLLNQTLRAASKSFMVECKVLRNVRHRNLIRVLTACSSVDAQGNEFKALVYEFMPNGSLEQWLYADSKLVKLDLLERLNIAHDVASAIHYLHTQTEIAIIHCDLKPSNILLNNDMVAHVSDFGISRFLSVDSTTMTGDIKGSFGYIAPECAMGAKISTRWDVYSYGILLLEMFTGKSPTDEAFTEGLTLQKYVRGKFPEHVVDVVDPKLLPNVMDSDAQREKIHGALKAILNLGIVCSKDSPSERSMQMEDVVGHLDDIKDLMIQHDKRTS